MGSIFLIFRDVINEVRECNGKKISNLEKEIDDLKSELGEKNGVTCGLKSTIKHLEESLEIYKHDRHKIN